MRIPYLSLLLLLALYRLTQLISPLFPAPQDILPEIITAPPPISNTEQQFALGNKIKLSDADLYDLELIPGVSDTLGMNILVARHKIIAASNNKNSRLKINPFELAHGVGEKTASKLERYLLPE